ncbi:MAG: hypothetical protein ACOX6T_12325 [Myxococcales bacterium]|jgi:hypothetical protein
MPEKSLEERIKAAKAEGKTFTVKESDIEPDLEQIGETRHGEKKSRGVIREEHPAGRRPATTSRRAMAT